MTTPLHSYCVPAKAAYCCYFHLSGGCLAGLLPAGAAGFGGDLTRRVVAVSSRQLPALGRFGPPGGVSIYLVCEICHR